MVFLMGNKRFNKQEVSWIESLRYWLADIYVRADNDYGPFRCTNRMAYMNIKNLTILIFHDRDQESDIAFSTDELISSFDPCHKTVFLDQLINTHCFASWDTSEADTKSSKLKLIKSRLDNHKIQLFGTNTYVLLFEVNLNYQKKDGVHIPGLEPNLEYVPLNNKMARFSFYEAVFAKFDGKDNHLELDYDLENHFQILTKTIKIEKAADPAPEPLIGEQKKVVNSAVTQVETMIDNEYMQLAKSPLLRSFIKTEDHNTSAPANIFWVSKLFNRNKKRYRSNYLYNPFFLMKKQAEDIVRQLRKMGGHKVDPIAGERETLTRDMFIPYPDNYYDDVFWNLLSDEKNIPIVLKELNGEWPDYVRVVFENTLMSGATTVFQKSFANGSLGWIETKNLSQDEIHSAYLKLVCMHFIFQLGSPRVPIDQPDLTIVARSVRVNGAAWVAACYIRENIEGSIKGLINQKVFDRSLLVSNSLIAASERRIRIASQKAFIKTISGIIKDIAFTANGNHGESIVSIGKASGLEMTPAILQEVNKRTHDLCRVFPFEHAVLGLPEKKKNSSDEFTLQFEKNPHFDRLSHDGYIDHDEIFDQIMDQIKLRLMENKN